MTVTVDNLQRKGTGTMTATPIILAAVIANVKAAKRRVRAGKAIFQDEYAIRAGSALIKHLRIMKVRSDEIEKV